MNSKELEQELTQLKSEADRLAGEELDETGDKTERYQAARSLNDRLSSLRARVDSAPAAEREELDDIWRAAERNLIFLLFSANQAETSAAQAETTAPQDLASLARQLSAEAFDLAQTMVTSQVDLPTLREKVLELDKRLKELAHRPGHEAPEVQKALGDADLDLTFVYDGGKGPMSLRMHRFIQSLN